MFDYLIQPKDITKYTLMRGVTDFGNLAQYNLYEKGYPFLVLISIPKFLELLAQKSDVYNNLITNYKHVLEYEFRGIDGLEDLTVDTNTLTNGINDVSIITKVNQQSNGSFSMRYFEKQGSLITKVHKLFLEGIKDSRSTAKHYHGLIRDGVLEAGYENEVFSFLYFVTDNTVQKVESAYLIVDGQPQSAETSMYNNEKGTIEFFETTVTMTGFPISNDLVDQKAKEVLDWMNNPSNPNQIVLDSNRFNYTGIDRIKPKSY